jgi:hypothetical protein
MKLTSWEGHTKKDYMIIVFFVQNDAPSEHYGEVMSGYKWVHASPQKLLNVFWWV